MLPNLSLILHNAMSVDTKDDRYSIPQSAFDIQTGRETMSQKVKTACVGIMDAPWSNLDSCHLFKNLGSRRTTFQANVYALSLEVPIQRLLEVGIVVIQRGTPLAVNAPEA